MKKITPFIWFEKGAEKAAKYYVSVFGKGSKINSLRELKGTPSGPGAGIISVTLAGQDFTLLNGGPFVKLNNGVSFVINCRDQSEVDYYWKKLSAVKKAEQCGWCRDKFGVTWQVTPVKMQALLSHPDPEKRERIMKAMLKMKKIIIKDLEEA